MPKNFTEHKEKRSLVLKDKDTEYGIVTKKFGNGRFGVKIHLQNKEVMGRLCGRLKKGPSKKNNWVDVDSVVLVGIRDFQDNIVDIVHVYDDSEVRQLKKLYELVEDHERKSNINNQQEDDVFDFSEI